MRCAVQEVFVKGSYDQWQSQRPLERTDWEGQPWSIVAYLPPGIYQARLFTSARLLKADFQSDSIVAQHAECALPAV